MGYLIARVVDLPESGDGADTMPAGNLPLPGQLRFAVEGALEIALSLRGAPPSHADEDLDPRMAVLDKLHRARGVDAPGVCVVMPPLAAMTYEDGALDLADSELLRTYGSLSVLQPLVLLFDRADSDVHALAPQPLAAVLDDIASDLLHELAGEAGVQMDDTGGPPIGFVASPAPPPVVLAPDGDEQAALDEEPEAEPSAEKRAPNEAQHANTLGRLFAELVAEDEDEGATWLEEALSDREPELELEPELAAAEPPAVVPATSLFDAPAAADPLDEEDRPSEPPINTRRPRRATSVKPPRRGYRSAANLDTDTCTRYAQDLIDAEGAQPVRTIEKLFQTRYTPLVEALSCGVRHEPARQAVTRWRKGFERSYGEGFATMRLTGKRPAMVLDAPDLAVQIGKLNGARAVQLLLVDSMRFDLGQRVAGMLKHRLGEQAVCVDQALLWSALPTITPVQMRLLERGPRGLREGGPTSEREPRIHRGRSVTTLRRTRIGRRDLLKLDVVEARLRENGAPFDERMGLLADEVVNVITSFAATLSVRTLLYVFGDHGFRLEPALPTDDGPSGTLPAAQGGSSPEEVFVPAYAWLVGKTH
jgi:hypothetical protein